MSDWALSWIQSKLPFITAQSKKSCLPPWRNQNYKIQDLPNLLTARPFQLPPFKVRPLRRHRTKEHFKAHGWEKGKNQAVLGSQFFLPCARCLSASLSLLALRWSSNTHRIHSIHTMHWSCTNHSLITVIDNKNITQPLEDKLIYLFKTISFQPIVLTGYLIGAPLN